VLPEYTYEGTYESACCTDNALRDLLEYIIREPQPEQIVNVLQILTTKQVSRPRTADAVAWKNLQRSDMRLDNFSLG
jgi:hypothetical protein